MKDNFSEKLHRHIIRKFSSKQDFFLFYVKWLRLTKSRQTVGSQLQESVRSRLAGRKS